MREEPISTERISTGGAVLKCAICTAAGVAFSFVLLITLAVIVQSAN